MDSDFVLQMRTHDALTHLAWLGPQIFRGQGPRGCPISNKKLSRRGEEPHLAVLNSRRMDLGGVASQRDINHLVLSLAVEFLQSRRASLSKDFFWNLSAVVAVVYWSLLLGMTQFL